MSTATSAYMASSYVLGSERLSLPSYRGANFGSATLWHMDLNDMEAYSVGLRDTWTDETADVVTMGAGISQWYDKDLYLSSGGQGIMKKRFED